MTPGTALVTGAGARLGKAMAQALGQDGWAVGVHYRHSKDGAEATKAAIEMAGGRAALVQADLACETQTAGLIAAAHQAFGQPVNLLVNSASAFDDDSAQNHSRDEWDKHMETNLRAPVHLAQQLALGLAQHERGLVVNLLDQRVWKLTPEFFTYTLSKAALWQATRTLAQALAPNVRVNAIGPGPTLRSVHQSVQVFSDEQQATLTQQGSSPEEIVNTLRFLISASSVTGQMIASDGGQHLMWQTPDTQV